MQRIAESEYFGMLAKYIFPNTDISETRTAVREIRTTDAFQRTVMYFANRQMILRSMTNLTGDGLEGLDPEKNYLFVSNHRDIMLDSSLLQFLLHCSGFRTTEISFGSNLMSTQLLVDIGKSNKMFKVIRSSNIRDIIRNSLLLSEYIRHTLTEKGESVWIAQRNGRTKDGNDVTDQGIIKMFCMSRKDDPVVSAAELNITPVAVSYETEPCDFLKVRELYLAHKYGKYIKQPGEDLHSILTGIREPKGLVHLNVCKPLSKEELDGAYKNPNEFYKTVASLIDRRIHSHYRLHGNNYIAHDLRSKRDTFSDRYTPEERERFLARCARLLEQVDGDSGTLTSLFLGMYATPVDNAQNARK
jgi:hypothetical protein